MRKVWKRFRYRLEFVGLLLAAKIIPLLSRRALIGLARTCGAIASVLDRHGRKVVLANLECAFGDRFSPAQRERIVRESYQHFAQSMLDLMWSARLNQENFRDYIEVSDVDRLLRESGDHPNVIIACYHYSSFEWFSLACGFARLRGTIVMQEFKNSSLDPIFRDWREQSGHEFIPRTGAILRLYKTLRRKGSTALLVDLTVPPDQSAVAIQSFGMHTSVTSAHAWLNQRSGARIFPSYCEPLANGRYAVRLLGPITLSQDASLRQIAQACWDLFEPVVQKNPAPWLWSYKHWRYRPANPDRKYPFYAWPHPRFEEMIHEK